MTMTRVTDKLFSDKHTRSQLRKQEETNRAMKEIERQKQSETEIETFPPVFEESSDSEPDSNYDVSETMDQNDFESSRSKIGRNKKITFELSVKPVIQTVANLIHYICKKHQILPTNSL